MIKKYYDADRLRDLRELVDYAAEKHGDKVALREFNAKREIIEHTYRQLQSDVRSLGAYLVSAGWKGRHFALIGESSYNYVICYLAIVNWVGVVIPIDKELSDVEIAKQIRLSDAAAVFCSESQAVRMPAILDQCPDIRLTVNIGHLEKESNLPSLVQLIKEGQRILVLNDHVDFDPEIDQDKVCSIIFTSGTTGANKGVMLCHRNITAVLHSALSMFKLADTYFSVLPINHTVEMNLFILGSLYAGFTVCFNDGIKNIKENLKIFQPDMSMMVPMIVDHLHKNIWREAEKAGQATKLKIGIRLSNLLRRFGIDKREKLFAPILDGLGGSLKLIFCGGAPLNPKLVKSFADIGINIYNGYGITECSPLVSSNSPLSQVPGSVGSVAPDCEVRISGAGEDGAGEIQVKGDNVMLGYYKDEDATRQSFTSDGWFKTGDIGYLDKENNVYITGRAKNLIISANGKNVYPEELEECLMNQISYLREVVVFASKDKMGHDRIITADTYLDPQFVSEVGPAKAREQLKADVEIVNRRLAKFKQISRVTIRETEFEKTTTRKIKRNYKHVTE
jgi:long-chain acyl-CoA synthetase